MIEFKSYFSGSGGNVYSISDGKTLLMLDCGIRWTKIQEAFNFQTSKVKACLLSEDHGDHSKAVKQVARAGIDVYLSKGTLETLGVSGHRYHPIEALKQFQVGSWKVMPFDKIHDCKEGLGFLLKSGNEKALFITDTSFIKHRFRGLTLIAIGISYDAETLKENIVTGKLDPSVGKRILKNHLSLSTALEFFRANDLSELKETHLLHMSELNSNRDRFVNAVQVATGRPVYCGGEV